MDLSHASFPCTSFHPPSTPYSSTGSHTAKNQPLRAPFPFCPTHEEGDSLINVLDILPRLGGFYVKRPPVVPVITSLDDLVRERISIPSFGAEMHELSVGIAFYVRFDYQAKATLKFGTLL